MELMIKHYYNNDNIFGENWFSFPNLYRKAVEQAKDGDIFVEIGAWKGRSASYLAVEIANSKKDITLYVVDTWNGSIEHSDMDLSNLYDVFLENMKPVEDYYFPLKLTSLDASKKFKDLSLDFIFIDGSHEYKDVKMDIEKWLPKVKKGGILAGHDYYVGENDWFSGVKKAVNEKFDDFEKSEDCWIYQVPNEEDENLQIIDKLKNFPSVNFISIEESKERRDVLYKMFEKYKISNVTPHIYKRYRDGEHKIIEGDIINLDGKGVLISHLQTIKKWYESTNEEYTIICEDDFSFDSVKYWNFSWEEFFNQLPKDWNIVQLSLVRENMFIFFNPKVKLRNRCYCDWSSCAYLISRKHAKNLIENYYPADSIIIEYKGTDKQLRLKDNVSFIFPNIETIIYSNFKGGIYTFPLFVENVSFISTWTGNVNIYNIKSNEEIINWWKTIGKYENIEDLKL